MKLRTFLVSSLTCAFLAACGGGSGNSGTTPTPVSKAEGFYSGSVSGAGISNGVVQTIVLENDQIWALYGTQNSSGGVTIYGLIQGNGTSNNGSYSASNVRDFSSTGSATATLSASYTPGVNLNGSLSSSDQTATFTASVPTNSTYNYNTAANLADITGTWSGTSLSGVASTFTINSSGAFSVNNSGCVTSGSVTPRASGKNVFDLSVQAAASAACGTSAGLSATGIVVTNILASGKRQLTALYVDTSRTYGTAFIATKADATATTTITFPLNAAYTKAVTNGVSLSGTAVDGADTWSMTMSLTPASDEAFEGVVRKKALQSLTLKKNGVVVNATNIQSYFSVNPLVTQGARYSDGTYAVQTSTTGSFAVAAKVGDSGSLGVLTLYTNANKTNIQATTESTWTLEADTATTAFGCANSIIKNAAGTQTSTAAGCYKIDTNGNALGMRYTLSVPGKTLVFK